MLRPAESSDAEAVADVFSPSRRLLAFLPELHTVEEDRAFIACVILPDCEVTLATRGDAVIAFAARQGEEIRLLHTHPDAIGQGAGGQLIAALQSRAGALGLTRLHLRCFQANTGARRFYERHGFRADAFTDGRDNEEKAPDMRYVWTAP